MWRTTLLLILMLVTAPAAAQPPDRWYKVMASGSGMWDSSYNMHITAIPGSDSILLTGFTNHGATVKGTISGGRIIIPKQTVTVMPFGGNGSYFTSVAEAEGSINDSLIVMRFYYKQGSYGHTAGEIRAIRWSDEIEAANRQHERQAANARHELELANELREKQLADALYITNTRDTIIDGEKYGWVVYDEKHMMVEIGQSYENHIKNGRWLYTDDYGRLDNIHNYIGGVLNGWTISYSYEERKTPRWIFGWWFYQKKHIINRSRGLYVNGRHVGRWMHDEAPYNSRKNRRWKVIAYDTYDLEGYMLSRTQTYPTGKPFVETFYTKDGAIFWYVHYDKKGNVLNEGKHQPLILLEH